MPALMPRHAPSWLTEPAVGFLARIGVTPNMLTVAGVAGSIVAAVLAGFGEFLAAGIAMLAASSLDFLDGALARSTGRATRFGSAFDAVMDRVSEGAVLFGLIVYFSARGERTEELLVFVAVAGSFLVSYVRARGEIIGVRLQEGIFTRTERVIVLGGALIIDGAGVDVIDVIEAALWVVAALSSFTALQRLAIVWWETRRDGEDGRK